VLHCQQAEVQVQKKVHSDHRALNPELHQGMVMPDQL
jgi:hypothetical protein